MKKILITGINGFIGRNVARNLLSFNNYEIIGTATGKECFNSNIINYIQAELGNVNYCECFKNIKNIDAIIHIAAKISHDNDDYKLATTNCLGIMQIGKLAKLLNVKQIIYISSIPIIGKPINIPITETHPINPLTVYHASKFFGENCLNLLNPEIKTFSLRIPSPIGADMPSNKVFSAFIDKCMKNETITLLGKGGRIQNYIDTYDITEAIKACLTNINRSGVYNIASPHSYSNLELAKLCISTLNSNSKIEFSGTPDPEEGNKWLIDINKAKNDLNFIASKDIKESILERKEYCENINSK